MKQGKRKDFPFLFTNSPQIINKKKQTKTEYSKFGDGEV